MTRFWTSTKEKKSCITRQLYRMAEWETLTLGPNLPASHNTTSSFSILSKCFIINDVMATGLNSYSVHQAGGTGIIVVVFRIEGASHLSAHNWNSFEKTLLSWSTQERMECPQMASGPVAYLNKIATCSCDITLGFRRVRNLGDIWCTIRSFKPSKNVLKE